MKRKKELAVLVHILFALFIVAGVSIMYNNPHYGEGISWLTEETYEGTSEFTGQFKSDINNIFNYVNYKEVFETAGKLDYSKPILKVSTGPGQSRTYTIDEMIRQARSSGLYLDENFKVSGRQSRSSEGADKMRVEWKAYAPDEKLKEPGDGFYTMDELAADVMSHIGNYYAFHYRFIQNPSNLKFRISYTNTDTDFQVYSNTIMQTEEEFKALGKYICVKGDSPYIDTNLSTTTQNVSSLLEQNNPYDNSNYYMLASVNTAYPFNDAYYKADSNYEHVRLLFIIGLVSLSMGILGCLSTLYYLMGLCGHMDGDENKTVKIRARIDRIPMETCILLFGAAAMCGLFISERLFAKILHLFLSEEYWFYGELVLRVLIYYAAGLTAFFSLLRRHKAGTLWEGSLLRQVFKNFSLYFKNHRFTARLFVCYLLFLSFNLVVIMTFAFLFFTYGSVESRVLMGLLASALICLDVWTFHQMYKNAWGTDRINDAVLKISEGDTTYKIDTQGFLGKERELAENINHISSGLETALTEKVRSERLKTDLITNVSHDIKTPLTSIINYVDLIKREHIDNPKIQGYLDVLEQKSQRLKTLTEDLVEASKASSGNLKLNIADIDFVELIQQTNGEFEEKFALRHLELVPTLPQEAILIEADGRYLWRVLENIYNNTFKYAMENSRVYADVVQEEDQVIFVLKNMSETPLNFQAEELSERFVRGDVSRATEGSGLGLSIARSLTELQNGQFQIYIDGDLFKAAISFPIKSVT